jgi:hypothetical protein
LINVLEKLVNFQKIFDIIINGHHKTSNHVKKFPSLSLQSKIQEFSILNHIKTQLDEYPLPYSYKLVIFGIIGNIFELDQLE